MKQSLLAGLVVFSPLFHSPGQTTSPVSPVQSTLTASNQKGYFVASRDLHSRLWQKVTWFTNVDGSLFSRTNSYTELATGLAHWNADRSQLVDSSPEIGVTPAGAQTTNSLHAVTFLGNINSSGAVISF